MAMAVTTPLCSSPTPSLSNRFHLSSPPTKFFFINKGSTRPLLNISCSNSNSNSSNNGSEEESAPTGSLKEVLSGMVDERIGELLNKQENRVMLDGLEEGTLRVEIAKRELAEFDRREAQAKQAAQYINRLKANASQIEECQREILEARAMVEEAERALQSGGVEGTTEALTDAQLKAKYKDEDRLESIKAGAIAAIVGTLAGLPFSLAQLTTYPQLILSTSITFVSCALFGVTFRYAVRKDLDDFHLKTGTAAAFGVVKGLATLGGGPPFEFEVDSLLSHAFDGAIFVSESLLIFLFAAVGLEYCIKLRILSTFPIER